jgi:hypothetical protein
MVPDNFFPNGHFRAPFPRKAQLRSHTTSRSSPPR